MNEAEANRLLREVLGAEHRRDAVRRFQDAIWSATGGALGPNESLLRDLAYDPDFYEPDADARAEDASYYDDLRLLQMVLDALRRLR
jgi:hypothetical protein